MTQASTLSKLPPRTTSTRTRIQRSPLRWAAPILFYLAIGFFVVNLIALVGTVVIDSFAQSWFKTALPPAFTTNWYTSLGDDHDIGQLLLNTFTVAVTVTGLALMIGFPAAYILARKQFRLKGLLTVLYLLPLLIPPLVYGIPMATLLLRLNLGGSILGIIIINLIPILPFVILVLTPFIEQVDVSLESASRMLGAGRLYTFRRIVLPLVIPGMLTAGVLAVVRTIALFDLTYLVATTASSQTLVVALYGDAVAAGIRAHQSISALAVIYMLTTMAFVIVALLFVKPTQFAVQIKTNTTKGG